MRDSARERIDFYDQRVLEAVARIERDFDLDSLSDEERDALWQAARVDVPADWVSFVVKAPRQPVSATSAAVRGAS